MSGFPLKVRAAAADRSGGVCEVQIACEGDLARHHHHRRARGMGSTKRPETNQAANDLHACVACHNHIESHRWEAQMKGWLVGQNRTPANVPVLYRGRWVLLSDTGGIKEANE